MERYPTARLGGAIRSDQNRVIGGSSYNPCSTAYVPAPPEDVPVGRTFASRPNWACADAQTYAARIDELVQAWRADLGRVRRGSAVDRLLEVLLGVPLITAESASDPIQRSIVATGAAIKRLVDTGVLVQRDVGKQGYRLFEAPAVLSLFASLERALARPGGDTATSEPVRPAPRRSGKP